MRVGSPGGTGTRPRRWGWRLVFLAGLGPLLSGSLMLALAIWSATAGKYDPWISLVGKHSFSAASLEREHIDLYALWLLNVHLCGANLAMSGATISTLAWFPLRDGQRWAWVFLWVLLIWVGGNDAIALIAYRIAVGSGLPYAVVPLILGSAGLILTKREAREA
jgi:hypothetical protein